MTRDELQQGFRDEVAASAEAVRALGGLAEPLARAAEVVRDALLGGNKLLACGNGGSAADAAHLVTEIVVRFEQDRPPYPAVSLVDSGSTLTAGSNDYGFDHVFERQVRALGRPGDVLVAFSTSGKSRSVLLAIEAAHALGMRTIAFLGKGGGPMRGKAHVELLVPCDTTARVQECHLVLYHALCKLIDPALRAGK